MGQWNPYGQTLNGTPVVGQVPCKTVVKGPALTAKQQAMAQNAYTLFCANHRLSCFNNTAIQGCLPDGSRYSIRKIGAVAIMKIQTLEQPPAPEKYLGGIGYRFVDYKGNPIISEPDAPIDFSKVFNVYEVVEKGTTKGTGVWRYHKREYPYKGFKATWTNEQGLRCRGVDSYRQRNSEYFHASNYAGYESLWDVFAAASYVGKKTYGHIPLPSTYLEFGSVVFLYKNQRGEEFVMQIRVAPSYAGKVWRIFLLAKLRSEGTALTTKDEVAFVTCPISCSLDYYSTTVSRDGKRFTIMYSNDGIGHLAEYEIDEKSINLLSDNEVYKSYPTTSNKEDLSEQTDEYILDHTIFNEQSYWSEGTLYAGYDIQGKRFSVEIVTGRSTLRQESWVKSWDTKPTPLPRDHVWERVEDSKKNYVKILIPGSVTINGYKTSFPERENSILVSNHLLTDYIQNELVINREQNGSLSSIDIVSSTSILFIEPVNSFLVLRETATKHVRYESTSNGVTTTDLEDIILEDDFVVMYLRGVEVHRFNVIARKYVDVPPKVYADAAIDPRSGGIIFSIFEFDGGKNEVYDFNPAVNKRHQAFVVDGKGCRRMEDVLAVPSINYQIPAMGSL
ncbi:hypothetical protein [Comamonas sp. NoAH]|uniref:hypothetical protein n=1 Tax=Comamonas halotolerans TaxID=3041496 RepID=UPI0024E11CA8|nr:hypothetical protein [Comamonas sp. NoAH]